MSDLIWHFVLVGLTFVIGGAGAMYWPQMHDALGEDIDGSDIDGGGWD